MRALRALFNGIMVIVLFALFLVLFIAVALAVIGGGLLASGWSLGEVQALLAPPAGSPSPLQLAGGLAVVAGLFTSMWAMLVSETAPTVGRFTRRVVKTALFWGVILAIPIGLVAAGAGATPAELALPIGLFVGGLVVAAVVAGLLLGKLFLVFVSERVALPSAEKAPLVVEDGTLVSP